MNFIIHRLSGYDRLEDPAFPWAGVPDANFLAGNGDTGQQQSSRLGPDAASDRRSKSRGTRAGSRTNLGPEKQLLKRQPLVSLG